jgi:hypothetical protein
VIDVLRELGFLPPAPRPVKVTQLRLVKKE